jgi:hypothetical protein
MGPNAEATEAGYLSELHHVISSDSGDLRSNVQFERVLKKIIADI